MSDNIEFGTETYGGMEGSEAIATQDTVANDTLLTGQGCTNGDCQNRDNPAELAWVKLVSAIPVARQVQSFKCVAGGVAAPSPDEVQSMVAQIRPSDGDQYALRTIAEKWVLFQNSFAVGEETAVAPILRTKLTELSNGWQGNDFDAFAEQMEAVFANCEQIAADIGSGASGMSGLLNQKADEIFALQGGDSYELPYPAPQYWTEDEMSLFSDGKIHVRAPFTSGVCDIAEGCSLAGTATTNEAMELGGFDSEYTDELNQYVVDQTEYHYTRLKAEQVNGVDTTGMDASEKTEATTLTAAQESSLRAEAERLAEQDANNRAAQDYSESSSDYEARAQEQNDTVTARWQDAETSTTEFTPSVQPSGETTFRHSAGDLEGSGYSPPGGADYNGMPSSSGSSAMIPPQSAIPFGGGPTFSGGNGGYSGGSNGLDSANPWESGGSDDDELPGGGLASGGGGLGAGTLTAPGSTALGGGGGMGGGGMGLGAGAGAGLFGPAGGGAGGAGRGAGAGGAGRGQGLFGKAAGGAGAGGKAGAGAGGRAGGGMMGGGRPAGAAGEDEQGRETWLSEDEDIWGLARFDDDNDPYA